MIQGSNKKIILLSILGCLWAIQATVLVQQLLRLFHVSLLINDILLPEAAGRLAAKWDIVIYVFFVAVALMIGNVLFRYYQRPINHWLLVFEGSITFLMVSAVFKVLIYDNSPQLAQWSLMALGLISLISKIFYPELKKAVEIGYQRMSRVKYAPYANAWWVIVILLMIYMPDLKRVTAMIYMGDYFHHWDAFIMSSGYASLCGQTPSVDVFSEYGVGLPVTLAKLIKIFGSFDYVQTLRVMMWFVIIYFILTYFLVRYWLKSALIAGVAFLLVFRLQMFHYGVSPLVWAVPSASPLRFGLDVLWLGALWQHMRSGKSRWLVVAALYSGFALFYMTSVGLAVTVTFYLYLTALIILPSIRPIHSKRVIYYLCWILPLVSALVFFGVTLKGHIFEKEYWYNVFNYMAVFGHSGAMPMYESLKYRHFWAFVMSMVLPFTYLATLFYIVIGLYQKRFPREWLFTALLCIYGLAHYQYYVVRAAITSYYVGVLPFVMIVCFWFVHVLEFLPLVWQKRLKAAALALSFYALCTNQNYLAYPNMMNFSRNPMTDNLVIQRFPDRRGYFNIQFKPGSETERLPVNNMGGTQDDLRTEDDFKSDADLVNYFNSQFDFKEDAALIKQLTKPGERVALISSFAVKILIQADRPPFFYHSPLLGSRPMTFRTFPVELVQVPSLVSDTISQIKDHGPRYIFMENIFLQDTLPSSYKETKGRVLDIIAYVRAHYYPWKRGKYLIVMKRKD